MELLDKLPHDACYKILSVRHLCLLQGRHAGHCRLSRELLHHQRDGACYNTHYAVSVSAAGTACWALQTSL
jgi:hypothetical protein